MPDALIATAVAPWSPAGTALRIVNAAYPFVGKNSAPTLRQFDNVKHAAEVDEPSSPHVALVRALAPLFKDYTVADAVHMLGMLRTVATGTHAEVDDFDDRTSDDVLIGVCWLLEKFACCARASGPGCVSARARLLQLVTDQEDGWGLGDDYQSALSRSIAGDVKALRCGDVFDAEPFGDGSVRQDAVFGWLFKVVQREEGLEAASQLVLEPMLEAAE